ncbi:DUF4340 domain-containing protein [Wenzhouxiangella sediminis]|uniref:DUF4340 domain-containing protein n=1 Tax=Wenzhouxiangella sediminis TaxID=1792836 RepID=A0A3E1KCP1_9GAMM|nr:DUF4340 domain-containing protein [Wenzhouxiangella sediminis]RFF31987.1 DUF4340 domain-containing protein [Wenzhouxiangella sediminis]
MNVRNLLILATATLLAVVLALLLVDRADEPGSAERDGELLPGLAARVNDIDAMEIVAPDGRTVATLHRARERWRMREKHDYEADFARIHGLLRELSEARRLEARTANPEWYSRLGVAAPGEETGGGTLLRFPDSDLPSLILGKRDPAEIGRYVRLEGREQAWLAGRTLDVPLERMAWLERAIMDIPAPEIREVSVRHPGDENVELRPGDAEGSVWVMLDPPADREVKQAWQLRQTANALAKLNMADVRPHEPTSVPADAVETLFTTRDGMVFSATTFSDEAGDWVHFRVAGEEAATGSGSSQDPATAEGEGGSVTAEEAAGVEIDIVAVDGRLSPWQFALEADRFDRLRPSVEDLLVAPEGASEE